MPSIKDISDIAAQHGIDFVVGIVMLIVMVMFVMWLMKDVKVVLTSSKTILEKLDERTMQVNRISEVAAKCLADSEATLALLNSRTTLINDIKGELIRLDSNLTPLGEIPSCLKVIAEQQKQIAGQLSLIVETIVSILKEGRGGY
jgi:uncharacterized protein YoxC